MTAQLTLITSPQRAEVPAEGRHLVIVTDQTPSFRIPDETVNIGRVGLAAARARLAATVQPWRIDGEETPAAAGGTTAA